MNPPMIFLWKKPPGEMLDVKSGIEPLEPVFENCGARVRGAEEGGEGDGAHGFARGEVEDEVGLDERLARDVQERDVLLRVPGEVAARAAASAHHACPVRT